MSKGRRDKERVGGGLPRIYGGEAVLAGLLAASGAKRGVAEVKEILTKAQEEDREPREVFPALFEGEPHFASPDVALQLYANLFGLWDRIAEGGPIEPGPEEEEEEEEEGEAPPPEPVEEGPVDDAFVEAAWRHLADLPQREMERLLHRYENTQPELSEHVRNTAGEAVAALETADTLSFELWAMLGLARPGKKIRAVLMDELDAALEATEDPEPALARYVDEVIAEAKLEEEEPLAEADAEHVARLARAVIRQLVAAQQ